MNKLHCCNKCWNLGIYAQSMPPVELDDPRLCTNVSCECHKDPVLNETKKEAWEEEFDSKFARAGFRANNIDWKVCAPEIKDFIRETLAIERTRIREGVEKEMYDENIEDIGAEVIAAHAYKDQFEAFRYGYNQACTDILTLIDSNV